MPKLESLTCFGSRLCSKVCSELLEHLSTLLLDEEPDEVGGCVKLQGQRGGEFAFPAHHRGLQGFCESIHLAVLTLPRKQDRLSKAKEKMWVGVSGLPFPSCSEKKHRGHGEKKMKSMFRNARPLPCPQSRISYPQVTFQPPPTHSHAKDH